MTAMDWAKKRQVSILFVVILIIAVPAVYLYVKQTAPTCFDNRQNQDEEGIDCGGACSKKCLGTILDVGSSWAKSFKISEGQYESIAVIDNPNVFLGVKSLRYVFKLYDADNILISTREGATYVNPGEQFILYEPNIKTAERIPAKTTITFDENPIWERIENDKPNLIITGKEFINEPQPKLTIGIENRTIAKIKDISVAVLLYDDKGEVFGANAAKITSIDGGGSVSPVLIWSAPFQSEPAKIEVSVRTDTTTD